MRNRKELYIIQIIDLFDLGFIWQGDHVWYLYPYHIVICDRTPDPNPPPPYEFRIYIFVL